MSNTVTGLYFVGLSGQLLFASSTLRGVGADSPFCGEEVSKTIQTVRFNLIIWSNGPRVERGSLLFLFPLKI